MTYSATEISRLVNAKKTSRKEQFTDALNRAKKNQKFNAWVWLHDSLEESELRRPRIEGSDYSPLNGVPIGVKDVFNTISGTTEMGSSLWVGHEAGNDARVLCDAIEAGCSILGKTQTAEFAVHALPNVFNPWDITLTPGTSSSGSVVAVACGDVPVTFGTQTAGSIIRPASFCGVIGFKPTYGVFPRTGILKTCDSFDTVGYFCSHYEDVSNIFDAVRLKGNNYPLIERGLLTSTVDVDKKNHIKIGVVITDATTYEDKEINLQIENFSKNLPNKYKVDFCDLKEVLSGARDLQELIYHKSLAYYFEEERKKGTHYCSVMDDIFKEGDQISVDQFKSGLKELLLLRKKVSKFISNFDLLIVPSTSTTAPIRSKREVIDSCLYWTMLQLPAISLPLFKHALTGLPFGLQLVGGKKYSEPLLFDFIESLGLSSLSIDYAV